MKIPIEKKRLFRILHDLDCYGDSARWNHTGVYNDDEAIQILVDMGFVLLKSSIGRKILKISNNLGYLVEIHLKDDFLTQVGLALFREEVE